MNNPTSASSTTAQSTRLLQILNVVFFAANIVFNVLANSLPLGGNTTGELSAMYPNLFTPAPITFSIWGIIYLLLGLFCGYQASTWWRTGNNQQVISVVNRMGWRFILTNIGGISWLLAWHYQQVLLSVVIMLGYLLTLIDIHRKFEIGTRSPALAEKYYVHIPFSIYLGWLSVATVANITTLLVNWPWRAGLTNQALWTTLMIAVVVLLALWMIWKRHNVFFGITIIWALLGILIVRYANEFVHKAIIYAALSGIILIVITVVLRFRRWLHY